MYSIYSDSTQLIFNGHLSYHPVFLTILNIDKELRRKSSSHRLVGLIPSIPATKREKKEKWFKETKRNLYQICLDTILTSIIDPSEKGRNIRDPEGNIRPVFPFFGYSSSDWAESKFMNLTLDGNRTPYPCGCCLVPKNELDKLSTQFKLRLPKHMKKLFRQARLMKSTKGTKHCEGFSLKFLENKLWKYTNPYISRNPDLLHHFKLGIVKKAIKLTLEYLKKQHNGAEMIDLLDSIISQMKLNGLKSFNKGILSVKNLKAWEYIDLAFYFPLALSHLRNNLDKKAEIIRVFDLILTVYTDLRLDSYNNDDLALFHKHCQDLEHAFAESSLKDLCKSKLKLVKFHEISHHSLSIILFEDPQSYSTEIGELLNRLYVKEIYRRGNKHDCKGFIFRKGAEIVACELLKSLQSPKNTLIRWTRNHWMTKAKQDSLNELRKSRNPEVKLFLELLIKFFTVQPTRVFLADSLWISPDFITRERIKSSPFNFIQVSNDINAEWYAKIIFLFHAKFPDLSALREGIFVQWMDLKMTENEEKVLIPGNSYQIFDISCVLRQIPVIPIVFDKKNCFKIYQQLLHYMERK